jgi:peptidyl-prolyl cis-trans isomerase A (cyclophilin A)
MRQFFASLALIFICLTSQAAFAGPKVEFKTTMGNFVVELDSDKAPKTTANFLNYVKRKKTS